MFDIFRNTTRPTEDLFFRKNDVNDARLGEIVSSAGADDYAKAEIVILGCPQDEGVARNKGRIGAAQAPAAIRGQFYKLTPFEISVKIFDLGDTIIESSLEKTHDLHTQIVEQILRDGKKIIVLGGGNDVSYPDGCAMAEVFGCENWLALNIDAHFDIRSDRPRNSGTPYRQLLDEKRLSPTNFYEVVYQTSAASPIYYDFLRRAQVNLISLEDFQNSKNDFQKEIENKLSTFKTDAAIFWGFDVDSVRAADAPGVSAPSPLGLSANEFVFLAGLAGRLAQTKIVEFTEMNPQYDIDHHTAKLVALAMHKFLSTIS